jgi:hypothetical protein
VDCLAAHMQNAHSAARQLKHDTRPSENPPPPPRPFCCCPRRLEFPAPGGASFSMLFYAVPVRWAGPNWPPLIAAGRHAGCTTVVALAPLRLPHVLLPATRKIGAFGVTASWLNRRIALCPAPSTLVQPGDLAPRGGLCGGRPAGGGHRPPALRCPAAASVRSVCRLSCLRGGEQGVCAACAAAEACRRTCCSS